MKKMIEQDANGKYIVNGVTLRGQFFPAKGMYTVRHVGSDRYAQQITEVAPDFTWFKMDSGELAVLVSRKNSRRYGQYVSGSFVNGKAKPGPTPYWTCMGFDTFHIVNYEAKTELDPSF